MMDEARIKGLIKIWHGKAFSENDHFSKFFFLWICFNVWLEYKSEKDTDAHMIEWLVAQSPDTSDFVERYEKLKNNKTFRDALKALANNSPIEDSRGIRQEIQIRDENDFENIVRAVYRIRCNLFHGGKSAHESRDKRLIVLSNVILNHWVVSLIAGW
jgi:hypothetical protein